MKTLIKTENIKEIAKECGLKHIAIIMDGNRRWAKEKNLPSPMGHKAGVDSLKNIVRRFDDYGIKYLTVYAFSTENWKRTADEVKFLMNLLCETLATQIDEMHKENVKIRFIGNISQLSDKMQKIITDAQLLTENNTGVNLNIAFNYGSRNELTTAIKNIIEKKIPSEKITENIISENLYTKGIPDPDLLIRTGGEKRISNYLLWQIAYSEIIVVPEFWPDFNDESLINCIMEFQNRKRRFGK